MASSLKENPSNSEMIEPGTLLLKCDPLVYVGKLAPPTICDNCLTMEVSVDYKMRRCASCNVVYYCNATCQQKGWKDGHKYECKHLPLLLMSLPSDSKMVWMPRMLLRLIVKLQVKDGSDYFDEIDMGGTKVQRTFADLKSNHEKLCRNKDFAWMLESVIGITKRLLRSIPSITVPDDDELLSFCGKILFNAHEIMNHRYHVVGCGVYLGPSAFKHSCESVAFATFDGINLNVRNTKKIPKSLPIDKITVPFINTLRPTQERREMLKGKWFFQCECDKCRTGQFDKEMRSIVCMNKGCKAEIDTENIRMPCSVCGHVLGKAAVARVLKAEDNARKLLEEEELDLESVEAGIRKLKSTNFSDKHWLMLKLFDIANDKATAFAKMLERDTNYWRKAYEYGSMYLEGVRHYLQPNDMELLRILLELGFASCILKKFDEADNYMSEARSIAEVLHGKDSHFIRSRIDPDHEIIKSAKMRVEMKRLNIASRSSDL